MLDFIPDAERLSQIFSQAIAPTFFLGAVAAFISLMAGSFRPSPLFIEPPAKPQAQHAHIALKRPDGMGEHTGPIPLNQEMPAPGKYIAQNHPKNRDHGIEHDDA
jgi:hypothetical protein